MTEGEVTWDKWLRKLFLTSVARAEKAASHRRYNVELRTPDWENQQRLPQEAILEGDLKEMQ